MSTNRRYDAGSAALRARSSGRAAPTGDMQAPIPSPDQVEGGSPRTTNPIFANGEYITVSVWEVDAAPFQPRVIFAGIEELAASIAGEAGSDGVGVLKPVLIRKIGDRYQLIDGERRLRACRLLAERQPDRDFRIPARVYSVSERLSRVMGVQANLGHDKPRAFEIALGYKAIRDVLAEEGGSTGYRTVASLSPYHEKSSVAKYLQLADSLSPQVLEQAGLVSADGSTDLAAVAGLELRDLMPLTKLASSEERGTALGARLDRSRGVPSANTAIVPEAQAVLTTAERLAQLRTVGGISIRAREPLQMMDPSAARDLLLNELVPAALGLAERGLAGPTGPGFVADLAADHVMIVVPSAVEKLPLSQAEVLLAQLDQLRRHLAGAVRFHRRLDAKRRSGVTEPSVEPAA
jgi:ParB-like chromosome segregation protein Spo0J